MGVANRWSIAYAIAEAMAAAGATLAITYLDDRTKREADELVALAPGSASFKCDVESDEQLDEFGAALQVTFPKVDALVHSIAFAPPDELKNRFLETSREGFRIAHSISADFQRLLVERAPLKDEFGAKQVAPAAVFLASDAASAITGETLFVDNGYNIMGM
jgi:enoyl-[acyl-carrier protein] reductase I